MIRKRVLFVCLGNICRSPMGEFRFRQLVEENGLSAYFESASAATSSEETGNPVYPPARRLMTAHGIDCSAKRARQLTAADYRDFHLLLGMDRANIRDMKRICGGDPDHKIHLLLDIVPDHPRTEVADPWFTGNFEAAWQDIDAGCRAWLERLLEK
ncbi:MAG: low molecular weight phosphotyrosine protein phosphatase [Lentisphaeria bacterium]|nr:low molecular weight phosphotyrosine protein phosphatase [Lentisphaeria bacterium]